MTGRRALPAIAGPARARGILRLAAFLAALVLAPAAAAAVTLDLPGTASVTLEQSAQGAIRLPVGPFADGRVPLRDFDGLVSRQAWTIPGDLTTQQVLAPLRAQLLADGFSVLVDCDTLNCGGFDFRFAIDVLPDPMMHVDLGNFRYFAAARSGEDGTEAVALLISRTRNAAFLQIDVVEAAAAAGGGKDGQGTLTIRPGDPSGTTPDATGFQPGTLAAVLDRFGAVVLDDLTFATGSSDLGAGPYASLGELAAYLKAHPDRKVALVGHTDASGGLDINIAVSRRRAVSVLERLVRAYGVPAAQLDAEGVGWLAPRASNLTAAGRSANRRVEAVLIATD